MVRILPYNIHVSDISLVFALWNKPYMEAFVGKIMFPLHRGLSILK